MTLMEPLTSQHDFSPAEKAIANYILDHPGEVTHMSIGRLAAATYTSNPAIVRLCRKIGLTGYRELRIELAADLERRRIHIADVDADRPFTARQNCATMMRTIAELTSTAVNTCYATVRPTTVEQVATLIADAPHVILYGTGGSCIDAEAFAELLTKLSIHCIVANRYADSLPNAYIAGPGDLALFITYSGKVLGGFERDLHILADRNCAKAIITSLDRDDERLDQFDYVLGIPPREHQSGKIGTFYSRACVQYLLNCIYGRVYALDYEENRIQKDEIDSVPPR